MTNWVSKLLLVTALSGLYGSGAPFKILNRQSDFSASIPAQATALNLLTIAADDIEIAINSGIFSETSRLALDNSLARANASSTLSLVMDRASNPRDLSVGVGAQAAVYSPVDDIDLSAASTLPRVGAAAAATISVGMRGDRLGLQRLALLEDDAHRLMVYLSGLYFSNNVGQFSIQTFNLGLNGNFQVMPPQLLAPVIQWGGLYFGSGLNFVSTQIFYSASVTQSTTNTAGSESATVSVNLDYRLGVDALNFAIPFEVSTNFTFLSFLTLYSGLGVDFNFGRSHLAGSARGPITSIYSGSVSVPNPFSGEAVINLDDDLRGSPFPILLRGYTGVQLNFWRIKIAGEVYALVDRTWGASTMVRFAL